MPLCIFLQEKTLSPLGMSAWVWGMVYMALWHLMIVEQWGFIGNARKITRKQPTAVKMYFMLQYTVAMER
ncbi:hypothetical protein NHP190012_11010 [Helicobacter sp. NHP19-012]|uniref:Uncharacterized protein n=1 Tax=Helicobacter gastrofelis TaxID=2849642 RepID=A0ABN6I9W0_9HELI|nr:hypothetical protein NHP190012_11010 [Helicobacter sp. NHP19-012]GMB96449.1 hypothetical protein NHP22001_10380 [Helicobacter sp. NHP22-001]